MGGSSSVPSELTHERLFDLTRDTRSIMDKLLEYTTKKMSVNDFLQLSNPEGCKKYVLFMTNSLHKLFYELQIAPSTDRKGVIFFRSIKELGQPTKEEDVERQSLCLTLAYFYTRIFQIYGALALTLIDDISYLSKTGVLDMVSDATPRLRAPGLRPTAYFGGAESGGVFSLNNMGKFGFLRKFLMDQTYGDKGFRTQYTGDGKESGSVYFTSTLNDIAESSTQDGAFSIAYTNAKEFARLPVTVKEMGVGSSSILLTFGKLGYLKKGELQEREVSLPSSIKTTLEIVLTPGGVNRSSVEYIIKGSNTTLFSYLKRLFAVLIPFVKQLVEGESTSTNASVASVSESDTSEHLKLRRIIENLNRVKPLGHCIARGLQLLRSAPFKDEPNLSYICKPKFLETSRITEEGVKTTSSRSGIPEPGNKLRESPGISALAQLFYDTILFGNNQLQISETSKKQYIDFITVMSRLFGDQSMKDADPETKVSRGIMDVQDVRDRELCKALPADVSRENLIVSSAVSRQVYHHVGQLFQRQLQHAKECGKIFQRLFSIQRDPRTGVVQIALSSNIINGGFPEINRVNQDARELLINYYKDCETTYLYGMKTVIDSKLKEKAEKNEIIRKAAEAANMAARKAEEASKIPTNVKANVKANAK